jgi:uncharacterized protein (TIGR00369 family)
MMAITNLEYLQMIVRGDDVSQFQSPFHYPPPIALTLGFQLIQVAANRSTIEMPTMTAAHANPMGTIHGGVLCDIADAAIGTAHAASLAEGESFTSVDLQINFFRPLWNDKIRASAIPVHVGKTVSRYVCNVTDSKERLVAQVTSTVMTLRGESAKGR